MVAIKDMEMPKGCSKCPLHFFDPIEGLCCQMISEHIDCKPKHDMDSRCPLVEIITCKDCIHYDKELKECMVNNIQCNDDFYCADAERR